MIIEDDLREATQDLVAAMCRNMNKDELDIIQRNLGRYYSSMPVRCVDDMNIKNGIATIAFNKAYALAEA